MDPLILINRLETLVLDNHKKEQEIQDLKKIIQDKDSEIILLKSQFQIAKSDFYRQTSKLKEDVQEARNLARKLKYERTRVPPSSYSVGPMPTVMGTAPKSGEKNYLELGPPVARDKWDTIINAIIKDTSVPESERFPVKQVMRFRKAVGSARPGPKEAIALITEARKKAGLPDKGPSIPDPPSAPIPLPPINEDDVDSFSCCFGL